MATLLAHITIKAGQEGRFEELARDMYAATHGHEKDVRRYEYWRGAEPRTYYCLESFADLDGFLDHQTSSHHDGFGPALRDVIESMRLEWVDPISGASPLVSTNDQSLQPGASESKREKYPRFSRIAAEWWSALRGR
ncbi:MAG: putative quinol monooxygenase [Actinomycetota bacterium]